MARRRRSKKEVKSLMLLQKMCNLLNTKSTAADLLVDTLLTVRKYMPYVLRFTA